MRQTPVVAVYISFIQNIYGFPAQLPPPQELLSETLQKLLIIP